nr:leucine-rich repeat domain-containing protein [Segatella copri]
MTLPSSVTSLGEGCFNGCSGLTSITLPSSVTSLGERCFSGCSGLETVYFKGKVPKQTSQSSIPTTTIIKVPTEYLQDYKDALGSSYEYIYAWNPDGSGDDTKPVTQCATPSVSYESGELKFASETAGAEYYYTITDADMASDAYSKEGKVTLSAAYNISVYATADGYTASDKVEATLYWINANLDNGTNINLAKTRGIVASAHDGIVSISGLDNGEVVKFFAADGKYLGSTVAANGAASYAVSENLVIAKVGKDSIKIAMK